MTDRGVVWTMPALDSLLRSRVQMNRIQSRSIFTLTVAALAVAAVSLTGCKTKLVGIAPSIAVTPTSIAFGQTQIGQSQTARLSVTNAGSAPLEVSRVKVATDPNSELALFGTLATDCQGNVRDATAPLAPSECAQITVKWTPKAAHAASGTIEIDSNDTATPSVLVPVSGTSVGPTLQYCVLNADGSMLVPAACSTLSATPGVKPAVDFGAGSIATPAKRIVRLTNQGAAKLVFSMDPTLAGSADFSLTGSIAGNLLAAGATTDLTITATPSAPGTITGALSLISNDPYAPSLSIPLTVALAPFPSISATPAMLAYPSGTIGAASSLAVSVTNVGGAPLMITAVKVALDPNSELRVTDTLTTDCTGAPRATVSSTLMAGECARFNVAWTPSADHAASGSVEIDSNDPQHAAITIPVGSQTGTGATSALLQACVLSGAGTVNPADCTVLSTMPATLPTVDFGSLNVNVSATRTVQLKNLGTAALAFSPAPALDASGSAVYTMTTDLTANTLAPGATAKVTITALAPTAGTLTSKLNLASNDQFAPLVALPITLTAVNVPIISVTPAALVYTGGTIGTGSKLTVSVSNVGTAALVIPPTGIFAYANAAELSVTDVFTTDCAGAARAGSRTLAPGTCARFSAVWTPNGNHVASGSFEIDSNDLASPKISLPVSSSGGTGATSALLQACIVTAGVVGQCTNLGAATPSIPTVDFGATTQGTAVSKIVRVTNLGTAALNFAPAPALTGSANYKLTGAIPSNTLAPGASADLTLTLTPTAAGTIAGGLVLTSNDQFLSPVTLPLTSNAAALAPLLQVCVLSSAGAVVASQCTDLAGHTTSPALSFGTVQPGVVVTNKVQLTNLGNTALSLTSPPSVTTSTNPVAFALSGNAGTSIAGGASVTLTITGTASSSGALAGNFNVYSNDARSTTVTIPISMTVPTFNACASSNSLAFGGVNIGVTAPNSVVITNCGATPLTVKSFALSGASQFTATLPTSGTLTTNQTVTVPVVYKPTAVQSDAATIAYSFTAASTTVSGSIALSGNGTLAACGTSGRNPVANVSAQYTTDQAGNGGWTSFSPAGTTATATPVLPLDYVKLDASGSTAAPGAGALTYSWALTSQPTGSTTSLITSGASTKLQTLVSGRYVITATVRDSTGCSTSTVTAFYVVSTGAIHIELVWDHSCGDLDLHYVAPAGGVCDDNSSCTLCDGNDVFYGELGSSNYWGDHTSHFPDWGCANSSGCNGSPSASGGYYPDHTAADDATLDHDNTSGYGPENITQNTPFNATAANPYQVWVYYYNASNTSCGTVVPSVYFYVDSVVQTAWTLPGGLKNHEAWYVANLSVANRNQVTITSPVPQARYNLYPGDYFACGLELPNAYGYNRSLLSSPMTKASDMSIETDRAPVHRPMSDALKPTGEAQLSQ
jgi:hypothetical protein